MKKLLFLCLLGAFATHIKAQLASDVVPNIDWVQYYSDKSNINNAPSALDGNSNVYLTGFANTSTAVVTMKTLKYDSLGNNIFTATYSNGSYDVGNAIRVDAAGNSYCAGTSFSTATNRDYILIKYSPTGTQLFLRRFNGTGNGIDEAYDIKLDASGNIYVLGKSFNSAGNYDIVVLKYSNSGTLLWTNVYNNTRDDIGVALVLSSNGNFVYVTGTTTNASLNTDIVTYRINAGSGATTWSMIANGTANANDAPNAIVLSGANVVMCGFRNNTGTGNDYVTIKYNGNTGIAMWTRNYNFMNSDNRATALVKDSTGNIAVTGTARNGAIYEYHTLLYDSTGTQLWVNKESTGLTTINVNPKIATDTIANHFYTTGQIQKATSDVFLYQITPSGRTTWRHVFDGAAGGIDAATNLCVNGIGVIYLSAQCRNLAAKYDITTIKVSQTPVYYAVDALNEAPAEAMAFTENKGQLLNESGLSVPATTVQYYTENSSPNFFFKDTEMSFIFAHYDNVPTTNDTLHKVNLNFYKCNPRTKIYAHDQWRASKAYFIPQFPDGVKNIKQAKYLLIPNIYPSIDLHYQSNANGLKYYFVVKPGGNPNVIIHQFTGASSIAISGTDLRINTAIGTLKLERANVYQVMPLSYTTYSFVPISWPATWVSAGVNSYSFATGAYNNTIPLVFEIDQSNPAPASPNPADNMAWNTYVGGSKDDEFIDLKTDAQGSIYALQTTRSGAFFTLPFAPVIQPMNGVDGAQIYKFSKYGERVQQTYFGATNNVLPNAIAVLSDSSLVLVGRSGSTITAVSGTAGAYTTTVGNSFILKYATDIQSLQWSTRYPGFAMDVDVNSNNDIYVLASAPKTGTNAAYLLTKPNALNISTGGITNTDANVVSRFSQTGVPNWSSFIPSYSLLSARIKVDTKRNNYYVFGTMSDTTDFEHFNKYGTFYQPIKNSNKDAFIQKFTSGDSIKVSTFYGGNDDDRFWEIQPMHNGDIFIAGETMSRNNSAITYDPANGSYINTRGTIFPYTRGWVNKFDSVMTIKWSTTYGDSAKNSGFRSIAKDGANNIYIGGYSTGMPLLNGLIGAYYQSSTSQSNACFLRFNTSNQRNWATYHGSSTITQGGTRAIAFNAVNNNLCYLGAAGGGVATSYPFRNFTSPQAYWQNVNYDINSNDAFVGRFELAGVYVGINEQQADNKQADASLFIYPNPTNSNVNVMANSKLTMPYYINVFNNMGALVYSKKVNDDYNSTQILPLSHLANGVYFIQATSPQINKTAKLIKE